MTRFYADLPDPRDPLRCGKIGDVSGFWGPERTVPAGKPQSAQTRRDIKAGKVRVVKEGE